MIEWIFALNYIGVGLRNRTCKESTVQTFNHQPLATNEGQGRKRVRLFKL